MALGLRHRSGTEVKNAFTCTRFSDLLEGSKYYTVSTSDATKDKRIHYHWKFCPHWMQHPLEAHDKSTKNKPTVMLHRAGCVGCRHGVSRWKAVAVTPNCRAARLWMTNCPFSELKIFLRRNPPCPSLSPQPAPAFLFNSYLFNLGRICTPYWITLC